MVRGGFSIADVPESLGYVRHIWVILKTIHWKRVRVSLHVNVKWPCTSWRQIACCWLLRLNQFWRPTIVMLFFDFSYFFSDGLLILEAGNPRLLLFVVYFYAQVRRDACECLLLFWRRDETHIEFGICVYHFLLLAELSHSESLGCLDLIWSLHWEHWCLFRLHQTQTHHIVRQVEFCVRCDFHRWVFLIPSHSRIFLL